MTTPSAVITRRTLPKYFGNNIIGIEMNATNILFVLLAFFSAEVAAAPQFEDFPAALYVGKPASVELRGAKSRLYASRLRLSSRQPVNFSGHYILATWGCGASCVMGAAIDAKTGSVTWLPFTVCCGKLEITEPLEYRPDSHLLIVHGALNEKTSSNEIHYFDFNGRRFAPIAPSLDSR